MSTHAAIKFDPISVKEAAELSGLHRKTVIRYAKKGKFRARRPTSDIQIDRLTLLDWLQSTENRL